MAEQMAELFLSLSHVQRKNAEWLVAVPVSCIGVMTDASILIFLSALGFPSDIGSADSAWIINAGT